MNQREIFKNPEFGSIRVIEENGKYLFCGTDVAAALAEQGAEFEICHSGLGVWIKKRDV